MEITELSQTRDLMISHDYKDRFIAEYHQLEIRYKRLKDYCNKIEVAEIQGTEAPTHDCPLDLLREQQAIMGHYLSILEKRAIIENIELF